MLNSGALCLLLVLIVSTHAKSLRRKGELRDFDKWNGPWFPHSPNNGSSPIAYPPPTPTQQPQNIPKADICDDGVHAIGVDFNPADKRHSYNYLCLVGSNTERQRYEPNLQTEALLTEHFVPPALVPETKCLNESLAYDVKLPTFGLMRPIPPKYGRYKYLPPQRWLHSLAEGAIVMLHHPCALPAQVLALQTTLTSCLYRHIVTPSQMLTPERPLALLAWGKSLELSVVDEKMIVEFIRQHAKHGPLTHGVPQTGNEELTYDATLEVGARLITDLNDSEICGFKET